MRRRGYHGRVEAFLLFVESWWWAAPVAAGAGAAGYRAVTTNRRRARRLELDAARHEERLAYPQRFWPLAPTPAPPRAMCWPPRPGVTRPPRCSPRRGGASAATKDREWSASLNLRAARSRIKAAQVQYHSRTADAPLPIEVLVARQDAVTARWLAYETDPAKALSFPQMLDAQHPATLAFLRAQRDAQELRPAATSDRVTPTTYLAYRDAVAAAEAAFEAAERDALGVARESVPGLSWGSVTIPIPSWLPRAADLLRTMTGPVDPPPASSAPARTDPPTAPRPTWPAPAWRSRRRRSADGAGPASARRRITQPPPWDHGAARPLA